MAANRFTIPQFDIDLLNWSNNVNARNDARARQRQQDWNNVYSQAAALGNTIRAENEAEKARKNAAEQAALQRQFQAQEAEKARAFQRAENLANRESQNKLNNAWRESEREKLAQKEREAREIKYAELISKENPNAGDKVLMEQILNADPTIDQYDTGKVYGFPYANAGKPIMGSRWADVEAQRAKEADEALRFANFRADLAGKNFTGKKDKKTGKSDVDIALEEARNAGFDSQRTAQLLDEIIKKPTVSSRLKQASVDATVEHSKNKQKEKQEQSDAKNKAMGLVGKKMNSLSFNNIPEEQRKYLSLQADGIVVEKK